MHNVHLRGGILGIGHLSCQQDNARPHIVRVVRDYLTQQHVDVLPWPAVSSDRSPIEHVIGSFGPKPVACVSTISIDAGLATATHWPNQCVKNCLWDIIPV
jgi:hypothetical protein